VTAAIANRERVAAAFAAWADGTGYITDLLAPDLRWTIVGHSAASRTYTSRQQFVDDVLHPFGQRFTERFRPVAIRGLYADGDTVIILWDGHGVALDGVPYDNTYAWFLTFRDGLVVEATAFYDSISFNDLWSRVTPSAG
jgi:ketosteroid isomerase-like protein